MIVELPMNMTNCFRRLSEIGANASDCSLAESETCLEVSRALWAGHLLVTRVDSNGERKTEIRERKT
jgi:hypothetical protein